jgi:hypothetical protein
LTISAEPPRAAASCRSIAIGSAVIAPLLINCCSVPRSVIV